MLPGQPGVSIGCDNFNGAKKATEHLLALGYKRIAFIGGISEGSPEFRRRYQGYCAAIEQAGLSVDPQLQVDAETSEGAGYQAAEQLRRSGTDFDAVFGASDLIAIGVMKALEENEIRIPQDIAVMGFDDIPMAAYTYPAAVHGTAKHQAGRRASRGKFIKADGRRENRVVSNSGRAGDPRLLWWQVLMPSASGLLEPFVVWPVPAGSETLKSIASARI